MIIIYEEGDYIELADDERVPYDLGAQYVNLVTKLSDGNWIVDCLGSTYTLNEQWFLK